ncbi:hypothetical protein ACH5RR_025562 [Cinchona calisaya]|uniref:Uncharacterized protein n=1 Tax=Cinchona calisaya TaxID=153742 RepID=A0ABD2Z3D1_9GENT
MLQSRYSETTQTIMESSPVLSLSPSFNAYSSRRLAEIAARVVEEFRDEEGGGDSCNHRSNPFLTDYEESLCENGDHEQEEDENEEDEEEEEEFEFAVVDRDFISSPAPADEIFYNGQIRPCFPLFNQDLLLEGEEFEKKDLNLNDQKTSEGEGVPRPPSATARLSLRKLFIEDREPPSSSCSSSEADELDGVQPGSYCVWNPKTAAAAEEARCKKSNSTGSSKRWKFRDLIHRSHSDGKDSSVFFTHPNRDSKKEKMLVKKVEKSSAVAPEVPKAGVKIAAPVVVRLIKDDGERRRMSFLPYRQDLVGFFSNANGLSRNLHPF